jgi:glucose/mannose transport system permease protein
MGDSKQSSWVLPKTASKWLIWFILIVMFLFYLMPVYVMVVNGLKEAEGVSLSTMWNLPTTLSGGGVS